MRVFLILFAALMVACQQPTGLSSGDSSARNVSIENPSFLVQEDTIHPYLTNVVESSLIMKNNQEWVYYDWGMMGDFDLTIDNGIGTTLDTQQGRFLYVFWTGSVLTKVYTASDGAYWQTSSDGYNWGPATKFLSVIPGTIYSYIWNVSPAQAPDGSWVVMVECSQTGGENPSLVELHSPTISSTVPDFIAIQSSPQFATIPMAGNAWVQYVVGKGWLLLCGEINAGYWRVVAYEKASLTDNWIKTSFVIEEPGIHVADPSLTDNTFYGLSLLVSYNQNEVIRLDASISMAQFYDEIQ